MTSTVPATRIARRDNGVPPPDVALGDIDLGSLDFWDRDEDERDGAFATLRRESPITFFDVADFPGWPAGPGHWALTTYDDIRHASRHPEVFSSVPTCSSLNEVPAELAEFSGSMINLDDPRHLRLRTIVNRAFTPKVVARIEGSVRERARTIVDNMVANHPDGRAELVAEASGLLPLQVICDMMGIPEEDEGKVFHWTNVILGVGDEEVSGEYSDVVAALGEIVEYAMTLAEERRAHPADDLTTSLVQAEVDGERLTSVEIASFFILLSAAGNETTRNAISHGMVALTRYPEERDTWWSDFDGLAATAVEEIIRWASPIIYMRRTLTQDVEMRGIEMKAGAKVSMWYNSGNRDEARFDNPWRFDVARDPNPQMGFGAGGAHFCLGANLARREIRVLFEELRRQVPDIVAVEEPSLLHSAFLHGIKRLPVAWTAT
ncbi:MAG TPA: cytochrome P450 [Mycobacterium sp.]|nr:cytochrome P450 [Mycobacterium sp.]